MTYDMFKTSNIYVNKLRVYQKPEQIFHVYLDVYMLSYMKLHVSGHSQWNTVQRFTHSQQLRCRQRFLHAAERDGAPLKLFFL